MKSIIILQKFIFIVFGANGSMILPFLFIKFQNNLIHNECAFYCENTLFFIDLIVKLMGIYDNKLKTKDIFFS